MKCKTTVVKKYWKDLEEDRLEISPRFRITNETEEFQMSRKKN